MIRRDTSIDDLVRQLNSPAFDPVKLVNRAVESGKPVKDQYLASVELMSTLNAQSQQLASQLQSALTSVQKSEKRVPHEINLLRNDISAVNTALNERYPHITELTQLSRRSDVLTQLGELQEVRHKLEAVRDLLELASQTQLNPSDLKAEKVQQLAAVFEGTPAETKWSNQTQGYYGLINKIMK